MEGVAYRYSTDGLALPHFGTARHCFFRVNDDSLNAGWASDTTYEDIVLWPGTNGAMVQLSWGASAGEVIDRVTVRRLDVVGRAGSIAWGRTNQLGSYSLVAVTQMRGATIRRFTLDDVVVYDDLPGLLSISMVVGDQSFGATPPAEGASLGVLDGWRIADVDMRGSEIGVGYRVPDTDYQPSIIQTGEPIGSWVFFAATAGTGTRVSDVVIDNLRIGGTCVQGTASWPGWQQVAPDGAVEIDMEC
mmetsp:Transcript_3646/g.13353  ORF Transcript_3646/g.13353 Transcript_3646/m.13353 type:complete len:246 (-) Transcript_3646:55-792(-)